MPRASKVHKFAVGQRVRRNKKIWKEEKPFHYGTILEQVHGHDNNNRPKLAYRVAFDKSQLGPAVFLEIELEETTK